MKCDILLTYNESLIGSLIRTVTKSKYTHVAIKIDDKIIAESWWWGVKFTKLSTKNGKYISMRCDLLNLEQIENIISFIYDRIDTQYDYKLLFGMGLNRLFGLKTKWDNPNKYICVELILDAFKHGAGINLLKENPEAAPNDLLSSKYLREVK